MHASETNESNTDPHAYAHIALPTPSTQGFTSFHPSLEPKPEHLFGEGVRGSEHSRWAGWKSRARPLAGGYKFMPLAFLPQTADGPHVGVDMCVCVFCPFK